MKSGYPKYYTAKSKREVYKVVSKKLVILCKLSNFIGSEIPLEKSFILYKDSQAELVFKDIKDNLRYLQDEGVDFEILAEHFYSNEEQKLKELQKQLKKLRKRDSKIKEIVSKNKKEFQTGFVMFGSVTLLSKHKYNNGRLLQ